MAKVSITDAAELTGKSRATIHRHINKGKISKETDGEGNPVIDTSELERVYGSLQLPATDATPLQKDAKRQAETAVATLENEVLKVRLEAAERERDQWKQQAEKAERREQEARAEAARLVGVIEKQTLLLTPPPAPAPEPETKKASGKRSMGQRLAAWWDGVG